MMLLQKQPNFQLPTAYHHRRHPSAPPAVVVVQPTRTPGLLSLSKPQTQHQPQPPRTQRTPRPAPSSKPSPPSTPPRRTSPAVRPSPAQDPFLVPASPTRKSARKRQHQQQPATAPTPALVPSPSTPLSIPRSKQPHTPAPSNKPAAALLSRSAPLPKHAGRRHQLPARLPARDFPICDDMTDAGDLSDAPPPTTPTRRRPNFVSRPAYPEPQTPTRPRRNHKRAPSDSGLVFHMSSDESGAEDQTSRAEHNERLAEFSRGMPPYFASSMFQNSPSPDELPDPLFV